MRRSAVPIVLLMLIAITYVWGPAVAAPPASARDSLKFRRLSVKDPGINNIEAVSLLIPAGWKTEGGVQWFPDYSILANLLMRITDPQTGAAIEFLPLQNFTWLTQRVVPMQPGTNYLGNILWQPITDVPQFIQMFYVPQAMRQLQGARVVAQEDLPKVAAAVARAYGGQSSVVRARPLRVSAERPTVGRKPSTARCLHELAAGHALVGPLGLLVPRAKGSARSPDAGDEHDDEHGAAQPGVVWRVHVRPEAVSGPDEPEHPERRGDQCDDHAQQRGDSPDVQRIVPPGSESQDRISQSFSEYVRGVETYKNPYEGRPVQLPSGYNDAWVNAVANTSCPTTPVSTRMWATRPNGDGWTDATPGDSRSYARVRTPQVEFFKVVQ